MILTAERGKKIKRGKCVYAARILSREATASNSKESPSCDCDVSSRQKAHSLALSLSFVVACNRAKISRAPRERLIGSRTKECRSHVVRLTAVSARASKRVRCHFLFTLRTYTYMYVYIHLHSCAHKYRVDCKASQNFISIVYLRTHASRYAIIILAAFLTSNAYIRASLLIPCRR